MSMRDAYARRICATHAGRICAAHMHERTDERTNEDLWLNAEGNHR